MLLMLVDVGTAPASIGQIPDSVSLDEINDGATPNLSGQVALTLMECDLNFYHAEIMFLSAPSTLEHLIDLLVYQNLF